MTGEGEHARDVPAAGDPAAATSGGQAPLTYRAYLALDELLAAQRPRSAEHDEMLFIVVHQVYELWFKQLLHELAHEQAWLEAGETAHCVRTLRRILSVLKVAVAQIDVLETMTPREFAGFRARLDAASGFESAQFRELEAVLGRRDPPMVDRYPRGSTDRERIATAMARPSLFDSFLRYLARHSYPVPSAALERDVRQPAQASTAVQEVLLAAYRDDGGPATVCEQLVDLDEGLQEWRYRHLKMVERTIGDKPGTGGSSGTGYLRSTLGAAAFPDLWAVRSSL